MIHRVKHRRNPITHKPESGSRGALCRHQSESTIFSLFHFGTERYHIKLTIQHGTDDAARVCIHDGKAVHQLGVIDLRLELQTGVAVALAELLKAVINSIVRVEGRQHVVLVERDAI